MGLPGLDSLSGGTTVEKPGTIMSYCHLVSGGYSNLSFTFGLDHLYGVAAHRVPSVMQSYVQGTASVFPACLSLVSEGSLEAKVYTVSPCRIVDTRNANSFVSTFSGDRLAPGETVPFFVTGNLIDGQGGAADCGVPDTASGVFVNVTAARPLGSGTANYLTLYPYGEMRPTASTINFEADTTAIANGVLVPLCDPALATCAYDLNVYNYTNLAVHLVIDVTGYLAVPAPAP
jgi:hypothetical protein